MSKKQKMGKRGGKFAAAKLPAGYSAVNLSGGFGAWWEFHKQKTLTGKVKAIDTMRYTDDDGKKIARRVMRVDTGNGVLVNVGESFALKELFDVPGIKGKSVFIQFRGQKTFKKGRQVRKINEFAAAYK